MTHYQTNFENVEPRNYIFEMCVSVDGRYMIVHDSVFDMKEQKTIGNLWDSIDTFRTIFKNTKIDSPEYKEIQEGFEALPITESNGSLHQLRDVLLEFDFFQDTWFGRELKKSGEGIKNFAIDSWEGLKKFGIAISKGDWKEILTLLAKGVKFVLRKLKDALYSTVGMIVDAILIATEIGKAFQWIPWALVLALDIYQMISDDWPDDEKNKPLWAKWMDIGFDVLGVVLAGAVAKGAKTAVAPAVRMSEAGAAAWVAKNPRVLRIIDSMIESASKAPSYLSRAEQYLAKKFPAGSKFIQRILNKAGKMMTSLVESLKGLKTGTGAAAKTLAKVANVGKTAAKGAKAGGITTGLIYGVHKGSEYLFGGEKGKESDQLATAFTNNNLRADFDAPGGPEV